MNRITKTIMAASAILLTLSASALQEENPKSAEKIADIDPCHGLDLREGYVTLDEKSPYQTFQSRTKVDAAGEIFYKKPMKIFYADLSGAPEYTPKDAAKLRYKEKTIVEAAAFCAAGQYIDGVKVSEFNFDEPLIDQKQFESDTNGARGAATMIKYKPCFAIIDSKNANILRTYGISTFKTKDGDIVTITIPLSFYYKRSPKWTLIANDHTTWTQEGSTASDMIHAAFRIDQKVEHYHFTSEKSNQTQQNRLK